MINSNRHRSFLAIAIAATILVSASVHAEENHPGYGYEPTKVDRPISRDIMPTSYAMTYTASIPA